MIEYVIKRDGRKEPFSSEKFNKSAVLFYLKEKLV